MAGGNLLLHFIYSPPESNYDIRTVKMKQMVEGSTEEVEFYKFHHPLTGSTIGSVTTYERMNFDTQRWENAGLIEWNTNHSGTVYFGIERISIRELRKAKKSSSKSRRFKAGGSEYKWKRSGETGDLICVNTRGKEIATWSQATLILQVSERVASILDRVVVTCFINIWMWHHNMW